jgi:hypothetical protein
MTTATTANSPKSSSLEARLYELLSTLIDLQNSTENNPNKETVIRELTRDSRTGEIRFSGTIKSEDWIGDQGNLVINVKESFL